MSFPTRTGTGLTNISKSEIWTEQAQTSGCLEQELPPASLQPFLIKSTANEELVTIGLRGPAPTRCVGRADLAADCHPGCQMQADQKREGSSKHRDLRGMGLAWRKAKTRREPSPALSSCLERELIHTATTISFSKRWK